MSEKETTENEIIARIKFCENRIEFHQGKNYWWNKIWIKVWQRRLNEWKELLLKIRSIGRPFDRDIYQILGKDGRLIKEIRDISEI